MQSINSNNNIYGILLRNMQLNKKISATATERLTTGKRINHASDSPSDILRINRLNSKIRGTEVAGRNIQDGVSLIQTTENSLEQVQNIGQRLKELSVHYNNDTLNADDKKIIENETKELLKEIQNIQNKTNFNGQNVFSKDKYTIQTGSEANDTYDIKIGCVDVSKLGIISTANTQSSNSTNNTASIQNSNTTNISNSGSLTTTTKATTGNTGSTSLSGVSPTAPSTGSSISGQTTGTCSTETTAKATITSSSISSTTSTSNPLMTAVNVTNTNGYVEWKNSSGNLIYVGNVTNGKYDGYGTLYDGSGNKVYQGNFTNGAYNGYGTIYSGGKVSYIGSISNGVYNGFGTTYDSSGNITYAGDFKNGKYDGYGTEKLSNGYIYSGYFKEGLKEGYGTLSNQYWLPLYAGNWTSDKPSDGRAISGYTPKTASDVKVITHTPPATTIPSTSTGGNTGNSGSTPTPTPGTGTGGDTGTGTTPNTGGSGTTTPPSTGTGGTTTPNDNTGNTGGTGGTGGTPPSTGNGGSNTTPPTNSTGGTDNNSNVINILKDDNVDKYILKPVREAISSLGIQEEILNIRYDLSVSQNQIHEEYLSKIEDVDMAKEMLKKSKADMLLQVNLSLFTTQLDNDRDYISMLLR